MTKTQAFVNVRKYHFADLVNCALENHAVHGRPQVISKADARLFYQIAGQRASNYVLAKQGKFAA